MRVHPPTGLPPRRGRPGPHVRVTVTGRELTTPNRLHLFSFARERVRHDNDTENPQLTSECRLDDLSALHFDKVDVRIGLGATFLAGAADLCKLVRRIHSGNLNLPKSLLNGLWIRLAGLLDRSGNYLNAVIPAKPFCDPGEDVTALLPLRNEVLREIRVWPVTRKPRGEAYDRIDTIRCGRPRFRDDLIRRR